MAEYVLEVRRPPSRPVFVTGVRSALMIPDAMDGLGQWQGRAGGYMQVEPAYERAVTGLGDDAPPAPTADELRGLEQAIRNLAAQGVSIQEARLRAVRAFVALKRRLHREKQAQRRSGKKKSHRSHPHRWQYGRHLAFGQRREAGMHGFGGIVSTTADFARLNAAQNHAIAVQAEISGIGKDAWDSEILEQADSVERGGWSPADNYTYDKMMAFWLAQTQRLLVYGTAWLEKRPSNEDVAEVERFAAGTDKLIALVKGFLPTETRAQAESDRRSAEVALSGSPMKSPDDEGAAAFKEEVLKRANSLASGGLGVVATAAAVLAAAAIGAKAVGII